MTARASWRLDSPEVARVLEEEPGIFVSELTPRRMVALRLEVATAEAIAEKEKDE